MSCVDLGKLRVLLGSRSAHEGADAALDLDAQLAHASIVDANRLPRNIVTIDSAVVIRDVESGAHHYLFLLLHPEAKRASADVSILEPKGFALFGRRVGDVVEWPSSGGVRRVRIEAVQQPADIGAKRTAIAAGDFVYA